MPKQRVTIDFNDEDQKFIKDFHNELDMFTGIVREIFGEKRELLLSPIFRDMILQHANKVEKMHRALRCRSIYVDNPCEPLFNKVKEEL